eukprot:236261-Hanusia_phi.AAC.2
MPVHVVLAADRRIGDAAPVMEDVEPQEDLSSIVTHGNELPVRVTGHGHDVPCMPELDRLPLVVVGSVRVEDQEVAAGHGKERAAVRGDGESCWDPGLEQSLARGEVRRGGQGGSEREGGGGGGGRFHGGR